MRSILIIFLFLIISSEKNAEPDPKVILEHMVSTCYSIQGLAYTQQKTERVNGDLKKQISDIKYQKDPFRVYMKQKYPKDGLEILYADGENENNALINPNGFPWVNVSLSPFGDRMRDGQHHTVFESGFHYFATIVDHLTTKYADQTDELLQYQGKVIYNDRVCHKIFVDNKNFEYVSHQVEIRQSLLTIAKHYFVCEHMILELNSNIDDYYDIEVGDIINRPNDYAKSITLLIDEERTIPLKLIVEDDKGLYEQYEFLDLKINPSFENNELTKDYDDYGF